MPSPHIVLAAVLAGLIALGAGALFVHQSLEGSLPREAGQTTDVARQDTNEGAELQNPPGDKADKESAVASTGEGEATSPSTSSAVSPLGLTGTLSDKASETQDGIGFDVVRVEPTGEAVIAGRAHPNAHVEILSNGKVVASAKANAAGSFVAVPERPLAPGSHDLSLRVTQEEGGSTEEAEERVAIVVPETPEGDVLVVAEAPGRASEVLVAPRQTAGGEAPDGDEQIASVALDGTDNPVARGSSETGDAGAPKDHGRDEQGAPAEAPPIAQEGADAAGAGQQELAVEAVETDSGTMYVAGAGEPGTTVRVYVDNAPLAETQVNEGGRWVVQSPKELAEDEVAVRADQLASSGADVTARSEVEFTRTLEDGALVPVAGTASGGSVAVDGELAAPRSIIIRRGDNLWTLSRRNYGQGIRYTTIYAANQDQIRNPDLIYPGQVFTLPTRDKSWDGEADGAG
ncbi:LysM peptidoglycan-binding domain-containing protein [Afifella sp. JA880]|uniref:LysM peptidoglycan-binding domain-containing protein n=1 Tax=Afifella sp. JA880 TaxID=2975280 RepID=UPI0021BADE52|nr:LysM peptidoglycan-binding domain-containing protein [Afifella sp. JA880]MCT8266560.1 LysM peptidoglycan-binding domain-containing protein [Afifella sp. JA880]